MKKFNYPFRPPASLSLVAVLCLGSFVPGALAGNTVSITSDTNVLLSGSGVTLVLATPESLPRSSGKGRPSTPKCPNSSVFAARRSGWSPAYTRMRAGAAESWNGATICLMFKLNVVFEFMAELMRTLLVGESAERVSTKVRSLHLPHRLRGMAQVRRHVHSQCRRRLLDKSST